MASVFKRQRNKNGKMRSSRAHYIQFNDHRGIIRRIKGFTDKVASEEAGRKIEKLVAARMASESPDAALTRWLAECPAEMRDKLGKWGIIPRARVAAGKPLKEQLDEWREDLRAKGTSADRVRDNHFRVSKVFEACGFEYWSDIDALAVKKRLAAWVKDKTMSAQTRNHYVQHLRQFGKWMVDHGRTDESPFRVLSAIPVSSDRRHERRALLSDEFDRFVEAARTDTEIVEGLDGPARAALYVTARRTGLRWSELRALRRKAFMLDHPAKPLILLREEDEKHPRGEPMALTHDAAKALRDYFAAYPGQPEEPAFRLPRRNVGANMVRHDLARAGIPYRDADGEVFDFHAIRGQLATDLARAGIPMQQARYAMRHSTDNLTLKYYTHLKVEDQRKALNKLPGAAVTADGLEAEDDEPPEVDSKWEFVQARPVDKKRDTKRDTKNPNRDG